MTIKWIGSPNYDGPDKRKPIDRVVIHWIVGNLAAADAVFTKANSSSAHYGVENSTIHQYVKEQDVAWHAGVYAMNQRSIGIEHSADPNRPASETTYQTSGKLIADICKRYDIPLDREHIIKHSEVKATQCPGTMDLDKLIKIAKDNMTDEAYDWTKERDFLVGRATVAKEVAIYLGIEGDPDKATLDQIIKVIAGFKGRASEMETKSAQWEGNYNTAQTTISNQASELLSAEKTQKALSDALKVAQQNEASARDQAKASVTTIQTLNDTIAELKGDRQYTKLIELKKLKLALIQFK